MVGDLALKVDILRNSDGEMRMRMKTSVGGRCMNRRWD